MSVVRDKISGDFGLDTNQNDGSTLKSPLQKAMRETLKPDFKKQEGSRRVST